MNHQVGNVFSSVNMSCVRVAIAVALAGTLGIFLGVTNCSKDAAATMLRLKAQGKGGDFPPIYGPFEMGKG